ncbi:MAG TPA: helix-turn-helix transcriptional regulator [Stackebrandtia sp.]|jgi:transcriptional regulator with XRE-family HTH domain|uniref:helix-turn-helix domain-containing protein n=1 Tax=Stackebrandtia sp. TaxID=2023065 RepID=UPI002D2F99A8|nr:helix-turn-helix transcriptional regulator [Stackebrandtia sp.]HZE40745.1 helix-turn-helix transcriptional regulator [Stackebrandtia sp.]
MTSTEVTTLAEFLRARRSQLTPEQVGLPPGRSRRVPGLRREELSLLAGVSLDYYTRLEQGRDTHPSEEVLDALARALRLDNHGRCHLHALARAVRARRKRRVVRPVVSDGLRQLLDAMDGIPALAMTPHLDLLGCNRLASALYGGLLDAPSGTVNTLRELFLSPLARELFVDWRGVAAESVPWLRAAVALDPEHPRAVELIGELSIHSDEFRRLWSMHHVKGKQGGVKVFRNPLVGEIALNWESFAQAGNEGVSLITYSAAAGSADAEKLVLLRSLAEETHGVPRGVESMSDS